MRAVIPQLYLPQIFHTEVRGHTCFMETGERDRETDKNCDAGVRDVT